MASKWRGSWPAQISILSASVNGFCRFPSICRSFFFLDCRRFNAVTVVRCRAQWPAFKRREMPMQQLAHSIGRARSLRNRYARRLFAGSTRRHVREAQLSEVGAFFFGDCSLFFIDCFDRIVSQFSQVCQEYTSPAFDSLSCRVKNLVRAGGPGGYLRRRPPCPLPGEFFP